MDKIIDNTVSFVKKQLANAEGGHDWWHIERVWKLSKTIARNENVDLLTVELAALLHDIADPKFHDGDESIGPKMAKEFLINQNLDQELINHIVYIIQNISFKNSFEKQSFSSPEFKVVQDADRIDAIGAIGIARAFNYGGFKNREMYNPGIKPELKMTKEQYKNSTAPTINHFYEKLLLLKNKMNTKTGKQIAEKRHAFMEQYLEQFYGEWEGDR